MPDKNPNSSHPNTVKVIRAYKKFERVCVYNRKLERLTRRFHEYPDNTFLNAATAIIKLTIYHTKYFAETDKENSTELEELIELANRTVEIAEFDILREILNRCHKIIARAKQEFDFDVIKKVIEDDLAFWNSMIGHKERLDLALREKFRIRDALEQLENDNEYVEHCLRIVQKLQNSEDELRNVQKREDEKRAHRSDIKWLAFAAILVTIVVFIFGLYSRTLRSCFEH